MIKHAPKEWQYLIPLEPEKSDWLKFVDKSRAAVRRLVNRDRLIRQFSNLGIYIIHGLCLGILIVPLLGIGYG